MEPSIALIRPAMQVARVLRSLNDKDELANSLSGEDRRWRQILRRPDGFEVITRRVAELLSTSMRHEFNGIEGPWEAAILDVQALLRTLETRDDLLALVIQPAEVNRLLMSQHGGTARRRQLGEVGEGIFDWLLAASLLALASLVRDHAGWYEREALTWLARGQQDNQHSLARIESSLDDLNIQSARPRGQSAARASRGYRAWVASLAPAALEDRGRELKLMEQHITRNDDRPYLWWRAGPWAGKSALMTSFASQPPPSIDVVAFVVIGRESTRNDRGAFYLDVLPQLATLANLDNFEIPDLPQQRHSLFIQLLHEAADTCVGKNRRLALLVDGLDEDIALLHPQNHLASIAGALPNRLPHGVRCVVASRDNPRLPDDVLATHPLRNAVSRRSLRQADAASVAEVSAKADLRELLSHPIGLRCAALLTSAQAPLTVFDLAELTGQHLDVLHDLLRRRHSRALRSVSRLPDDDYSGLQLGHEALETLLIRQLVESMRVSIPKGENPRSAALGESRERLCVWGQSWRDLGWPASTPDFLLSGAYPELLRSIGERVASVETITDARRVQRLDARFDGPFEALNQCLSLYRKLRDEPQHRGNRDLVSLGRLVLQRHAITSKAAHVPNALLNAYAALGDTARITSLVKTGTTRQTAAAALATAGRVSDARMVAEDTDHPTERARALAGVAAALAKAGLLDQAREVAADLDSRLWRAEALVSLVTGFIDAGDLDEARRIAEDIDAPRPYVQALAAVAAALARADRLEAAEQLAEHALAFAEDIYDEVPRTIALAAVAPALSACGQTTRANDVAERVRSLGQALDVPDRISQAELAMCEAMSTAKQGTAEAVNLGLEALALVDEVDDPWERDRALARLAPALAVAGKLNDLHRVVDALVDSPLLAGVMSAVATAFATNGETELAIDFAERIEDPAMRIEASAGVAVCLARAGLVDEARSLADRAMLANHTMTVWPGANALLALTRKFAVKPRMTDLLDTAAALVTMVTSTRDVWKRDEIHVQLASSLTRAGATDRALDVVALIESHALRSQALTGVATTLARAGAVDQARELSARVEYPWDRSDALAEVAVALVGRGEVVEARGVIDGIGEARDRAGALTRVARSLIKSGNSDLGRMFAADAWTAADGIPGPRHDQTMVDVAATHAAAGEVSRACAIAEGITDSKYRFDAFIAVGATLISIGALVEGHRVFDDAGQLAGELEEPDRRAFAFGCLAAEMARLGYPSQARGFAMKIDNVLERDAALVKVVRAYTTAGDLAYAHNLVQEFGETWHREDAGIVIATALARAGRMTEALEIAGAADLRWQEPKALLELVAALIPAEGISHASAVTNLVFRGGEHMRTRSQSAIFLAEVATSYLEAGSLRQARMLSDHALKVAEGIESREDQRWCINRILITLARSRRSTETDIWLRSALVRLWDLFGDPFVGWGALVEHDLDSAAAIARSIG